ncbi:hypothetical protein [[Limnothrix rosea] IAM M-220]|uniref:hypothetical protein n=1 Tax=[Limnothrix rosea] IAM M-220 TaxID=454133 RepID=UPI00111570FD|nr:hypothetical protein [[Limnothrix rosea] IAM M-220]
MASFLQERDKYDMVVEEVQAYRDNLDCSEPECSFSSLDVGIDEEIHSSLGVGIFSIEPLVIQFQPVDSIYAKIWYAETQEAEDYLNALPEVNPSAYTMYEMEEQWFLVRLDWN